MEHARTAIQSAHHHYRQAMDLVDAVCGPKKNKWEAILGDEQSRQETYRGEFCGPSGFRIHSSPRHIYPISISLIPVFPFPPLPLRPLLPHSYAQSC